MKKLLEFLSQQLTGNFDIQVREVAGEGNNLYTILAPKTVMGLLIGKGGKTIRAIRSLAKARAIIDQEKISIELQEII